MDSLVARSLICKVEELDRLIDEGFEDFTEEDDSFATNSLM